jgi:hypothetical protein
LVTSRPMLSDETRKRLRRARKKYETAIAERDQLIRDAVAEGGTLREVGVEIGLSHTAIKYIARGRAKPPSTN